MEQINRRLKRRWMRLEVGYPFFRYDSWHSLLCNIMVISPSTFYGWLYFYAENTAHIPILWLKCSYSECNLLCNLLLVSMSNLALFCRGKICSTLLLASNLYVLSITAVFLLLGPNASVQISAENPGFYRFLFWLL